MKSKAKETAQNPFRGHSPILAQAGGSQVEQAK